MSSTRPPSLALLSLNVNGLGTQAKRLSLFHALIHSPYDIILLQETHHRDTEQGLQWSREGAGDGRPWPGATYWAHGTTASRGVAVLLRDRHDWDNLPPEPCNLTTSEESEGRILRIDLSWGELPLSIISVYAPSLAEHRNDFYLNHLMHAIPQSRHILIGGDFNCVADDLDVTPNALGTRRTGYVGGLHTVQQTFGLTDVWRDQHPTQRSITHVCASSLTGARLDRWLVSTDVLFHCSNTDTVEGLPGDHTAISMSIVSPQGIEQGPRAWTFPAQLTDDKSYEAELHSLIDQYLSDHVISDSLSHRDRWDGLKAEIRDHCIEYQRRAALKQSAMHRLLVNSVRKAREAFVDFPSNPERFEDLQRAQREIDAFASDKARQAAARASALWQHYGEQSTFYFYHLEQERKRKTAWVEVQDTNGQKIPLHSHTDRVRAGQTLANHFSSDSPIGLFQKRAVDTDAQTSLLTAIDKTLSPDDRATCDGEEPLTLTELHDSLQSMQRGKKPGSDGLTYEFLQQYWLVLGPILLQVFLEAFNDTLNTGLSLSQRSGIITLLYKGSGSKSDPASYRPLTLLNTDVKLLGRVLSDRWLTCANKLVDDTQSAFLPQRWIGDNILTHLEMVDYCESHQTPGCIAFLDFAKAYDRVDRDWLDRAMQALGFGPQARRWVALLHTDLSANVRFNNWLSPQFPVNNGLAQGSPLSPLLYILAAQPLTAHLRLMVAQGQLEPLPLPDGSRGPPCHQHADDLTLTLANKAEVKKAIDLSITLFCQASGSQLNATKSKAMLIGNHPCFEGEDPDTGVQYIARGECIRHLGVQLSTDVSKATKATYSVLENSIRSTTRHWAAKQLTYLGRVHVAKQAIASKLTFHATFLPVPQGTMQTLSSSIAGFVAQTSGTMRPSRIVHSLPYDAGGLNLTTLATATTSLQAKVVSRFLEPERLPWKLFFATHFSSMIPSHGARWIFSSRRTQDLGIVNLRARTYVSSFRKLEIGRGQEVSYTAAHVLSESLIYNPDIKLGGNHLTPTNLHPSLSSNGIFSLYQLHVQRDTIPQEVFETIMTILPSDWRDVLAASDTETDTWLWDGDKTVWQKQTAGGVVSWSTYNVLQNKRLAIACAPSSPTPEATAAAVTQWDPGRKWRPGKRHPSDQGHYLLGEISPASIFPEVWSVGGMAADEMVVRQCSLRITMSDAIQAKVLLKEQKCVRPALWDRVTSTENTGLEDRWISKIQEFRNAPQLASSSSQANTRSFSDVDYAAGQAWMSQPQRPRPHWRERLDVAAVTPPVEIQSDDQALLPLEEPWTLSWKRLQGTNLDRQHRHIAWRVLHATLPCGALNAYRLIARAPIDAATLTAALQRADCPFCDGHIHTLSHMLVDCQVAAQVWSWATNVWTKATLLPAPHISHGLILLDDRREWNVPKEAESLWTDLRLIVMAGLYTVSLQKVKGLPVTGHTVAAYAVHHMRSAITKDWLRIEHPQGGVSVLNALSLDVCSSSYLRGRKPGISASFFAAKWAFTDALCVVTEGRLQVRLSLQHPIVFSSHHLMVDDSGP